MKQQFIAIPILFFSFHVYAQTLSPAAATYTGLGAYSIQQADVFSFTANQASLAQLKNISAGIYSERKFLLKELSLYNLVFGLPTSSGNFGFEGSYYGFSNYNETQLGLAYARQLGGKADVGVQFNYNTFHIAGYGNAAALDFEIGTVLHLTDKLHAGFHARNPVGGKIGKNSDEKLASVYTAGAGYDASEKFFVNAEIEKEEDAPVNLNAGFQYQPVSQLIIRAGIATATSIAFAGFGIKWKTMRLDVTATYHPQLGITPGLLILITSNKKKE